LIGSSYQPSPSTQPPPPLGVSTKQQINKYIHYTRQVFSLLYRCYNDHFSCLFRSGLSSLFLLTTLQQQVFQLLFDYFENTRPYEHHTLNGRKLFRFLVSRFPLFTLSATVHPFYSLFSTLHFAKRIHGLIGSANRLISSVRRIAKVVSVAQGSIIIDRLGTRKSSSDAVITNLRTYRIYLIFA